MTNLCLLGAGKHEVIPHLHVVGETERHVVVVRQVLRLQHEVELALLGQGRVEGDHRPAGLPLHAPDRHPEAALGLEAF